MNAGEFPRAAAARIRESRSLAGVEGYLWAFKRRAQLHHCIGYGTLQVEIDRLAALRKRYSHEIRPVTLLPALIKAMALAVERNPQANAILFKKLFGYRIVSFDRADVNVPVTRLLNGAPFIFLVTVRDAARKRIAEIQDEIAAVQREPAESLPQLQRINRFARVPLWVARLFHAVMMRSPAFYVRNAGTCGLTTLDGAAADYFFPIGPTSAVFSIGAARPTPVVRDGQIVVRRMLNVCVAIDNYVVPGPAGAKLVRDFKDLVETGRFMEEELR